MSQVQDFQIKFILVMENVLLLCWLFSDKSWKKNSFAKSRGTPLGWFLLNNGYLEGVDGV